MVRPPTALVTGAGTGTPRPLHATSVPRDQYRVDPQAAMGLEAELLIYQVPSMTPASRATMAEIVHQVRRAAGDEVVSLEFGVHQVEIKTAPHTSLVRLAEQYRGLLGELVRAAERCDALVLPISLDPLSLTSELSWEQVSIAALARRKHGAAACKLQGIGSLQWSLSVEDGNAAIYLNNALRRCVHHLLALTANSPFFDGRPAGVLSMRANLRGVLLDSGWVQEHISETSWQDYFERRRRMCSIGPMMSAPWSHNGPVRIRPDRDRCLCIEISSCDLVPTVGATLALAQLIRRLVTRLLMDYVENRTPPDCFGPAEQLGIIKSVQGAAMLGPGATFLRSSLEADSAASLISELAAYAADAPGAEDDDWADVQRYVAEVLQSGPPGAELLRQFRRRHGCPEHGIEGDGCEGCRPVVVELMQELASGFHGSLG